MYDIILKLNFSVIMMWTQIQPPLTTVRVYKSYLLTNLRYRLGLHLVVHFTVLQTVRQKCDLVFTSTVSIRSTNKPW